MLALVVVGMLAGTPVHVVGPEAIQEALSRPQETLTQVSDHEGLSWWHRAALLALLGGDGVSSVRAIDEGRPEVGLWARPFGHSPSLRTVWISRAVAAGGCLAIAEILTHQGKGPELREITTASIGFMGLVVFANALH